MISYVGVREEEEGLEVPPKNKVQYVPLGEQKRQGGVWMILREEGRDRMAFHYLYLLFVGVKGVWTGAAIYDCVIHECDSANVCVHVSACVYIEEG